MRAFPHATVAPTQHCRALCAAAPMEGAMHRSNLACDDDETPPPEPVPDHLTAIFVWLESGDDAPEDAPQELTTLYPDPPG